MLLWLSENIGTVLVCAFLAVIVIAIVISMIRQKRNGKSSCSCGCAGCPMSGECHKPK